MNADQVEFLISQYADGTLAPADRGALESHLDAHPADRRLVDEYRELDALLRTAAPSIPPFDYDALASRINDAIDDANTAAAPIRLPSFPWQRLGAFVAVAACVAIAVGLWLRPAAAPSPNEPTVATTANKPAVLQVAVLQPDDARLEYGPALQQIHVGPPAGQSRSPVISEAIVTRPNTLFIAKADEPAQDTSRPLY
jgi:anti-sigma factor RsiW